MKKSSDRPVPTGQKQKERTEQHNMLLFCFKAFYYGGGGLMAATAAEDARAAFDRRQATGWGR